VSFERKKRFALTLSVGKNDRVRLRRAKMADKTELIALYQALYGEDYPLEIVREPGVFERHIRAASYFWPIVVANKQIVGSVIFCVDRLQSVIKVYGAVIHPDWQGHDIMRQAIVAGLDYLRDTGSACDVVYATTRTVSPAPERLVRRIGFKTLGIFPNVRKVQRYETHGLNVYYHRDTLAKRLTNPRLIPQVKDFYLIAKDICELPDDPIVERVELPTVEPRNLNFKTIDDPKEVRRRFELLYETKMLRFSFFPFHEPHLCLESDDGGTAVFLHHNQFDNYGCILGLRTDRHDMESKLHQVCDEGIRLELRYIKLLVSAFDSLKQRQAWDAHFLPCAYFPAMKPFENDKRMDYLVFSRSFENLDFTCLELSSEEGERFLEAFMKSWYWHLLKNEPDFSKLGSFSA